MQSSASFNRAFFAMLAASRYLFTTLGFSIPLGASSLSIYFTQDSLRLVTGKISEEIYMENMGELEGGAGALKLVESIRKWERRRVG